MTTSEDSERRRSVRLPILSETTLLLMIAAGFFILHILAAIDLRPQSAAAAPLPEANGAMLD